MKKIVENKIKMVVAKYALILSLPSIITLILILLFGGGGSFGASTPVDPPATPAKAEEYGIVCSEMGVPWDLVMLTDAFFAQQEGKPGIEDINPIYTCLEFLFLNEDREEWEIVGYTTDDEGNSVAVYDWVYKETVQYTAKKEILEYIGIQDREIEDLSPSKLLSLAQEVASNKSTSYVRFKVAFATNTDFKTVLLEYIGIDEKNVDKIIELYEARYLPLIYFGSSAYNFNSYDLPDVTVGNVTRMELLTIASTLIGHPYGWGGKSLKAGSPSGPLDCSGYIDWVYFQCFGKGINGGSVPNGIIQNGTAMQFYSCAEISESELKIGDLGFYHRPEDVKTFNHVGIYAGEINGKKAFIHCGGSEWGYKERPTGRVGISINSSNEKNNINIITGGSFSPPMGSSNFKYFMRPQFQFADD